MKPKIVRRLELNRETVRELTSEELRGADGGRLVVTTTRLVSIPASACPCVSMGAEGGCTATSC